MPDLSEFGDKAPEIHVTLGKPSGNGENKDDVKPRRSLKEETHQETPTKKSSSTEVEADSFSIDYIDQKRHQLLTGDHIKIHVPSFWICSI